MGQPAVQIHGAHRWTQITIATPNHTRTQCNWCQHILNIHLHTLITLTKDLKVHGATGGRIINLFFTNNFKVHQ
jgi:hypothetical protein